MLLFVYLLLEIHLVARMSPFFFKICSVSVIITSDMDKKCRMNNKIYGWCRHLHPPFRLNLRFLNLESLLCRRSNSVLFPLAAPHVALPLIFFPLSSTNCCIHTRNDCCNKKKKDRVTLGLCTNISGKERLKLVFIHKSTHPRCFPRNFDPNRTVHYYCNKST